MRSCLHIGYACNLVWQAVSLMRGSTTLDRPKPWPKSQGCNTDSVQLGTCSAQEHRKVYAILQYPANEFISKTAL